MWLVYKYLIDKHNVISFDIFDTLLIRDVYDPTDVFEYVGEIFFGENNGKGFKQKRIKAESVARKKVSNGEVNLEDIYLCMDEEDLIKRERLKAIELQYEIEHCICRKKMYKVFDYAFNTGKQIVLISDMYLPIETIMKMLEKCGYESYKYKLYISNQYHVNKVEGLLFDRVFTELGIDKNTVIHFGDNIYADIKGAKKAGIASIWIPKEKMILRYAYKVLRKLHIV